ncbi:MAG: hypothetical protein WCY09_08280 [Candidatus Omnitrophota bacterium]
MKPDYRGAWIAVYSRLLDSGDFLSLSCAERSVFFQSLLLAARTEHDLRFHERTYHLQPGQFVTTLPELAKLCGKDCSVKIVRRTVDKLRACKTWADGRADGRADAPRLITWLNWSLYQLPYGDRADGRADGRAGLGQTEGTQTLSATDGKNSNTVVTSLDTQTRTEKNTVLKRSSPSIQKKVVRNAPEIGFDYEKGAWEGIDEKHTALWHTAYPSVVLETELAKMAAWLLDNPSKKYKSYGAFIRNWLSRAKGEPMKHDMSSIGKANVEEWNG